MRFQDRVLFKLTSLACKAKINRFIFGTPGSFLNTKDWVEMNKDKRTVSYILVEKQVEINEKPPVIVGNSVSKRFTKYYNRKSNEGFVAIIPGARVFGEYTNIIITPDNQVLADVSREFGAEGGRKPQHFSIFRSVLKMPRLTKLKGKIAVISTAGSNNFHHWNFDVLPRLSLLRKSGLIHEIDHFIINHSSLPFQLEGLKKMNIDTDKIINPSGNGDFYIQAEKLFIPSLPEELGTITPWVIDFLRNTFLNEGSKRMGHQRLFISRGKVTSRRLINHDEVMSELLKYGYNELVPEEYSMEEVACFFSSAESIVSVHGSGISNLPFIEAGTRVLDILGPFHQDPYYWMICNQRNAEYFGIYAEGEQPDDDLDLVKTKVDLDLLISMPTFRKALDLVSKSS